MTPRETAAYTAGIRTALDFARIAAVTIETREGFGSVRDRAAVETLQGFAEGLRAALLDPQGEPDTIHRAIAAIAADPAQAGEIPCPSCGARFRWAKDSGNRHIHAECESADCLRVMQ